MREIIVELPIFTAKRLEKIPQEDFFNFFIKKCSCNCLYNFDTIALKERRKV